MARLRTTTIFNKNRVTITRYDNYTATWQESQDPHISETTKSSCLPSDNTVYYGRYQKNKQREKLWVKKKFESPLGFWYEKEVYVGDVSEKEFRENNTKSIREISFVFKDHKYLLTYLITYNGTYTSTETRPWDLYGHEFSDENVKTLFDLVEKLFMEAKDEKLKVLKSHEYNRITREYEDKFSDDIGTFRNEIYAQLFGNSKGPRFQSNREKIEAHGFDFKTSFRKM